MGLDVTSWIYYQNKSKQVQSWYYLHTNRKLWNIILADKYTFTIAEHSKMNHWAHTTAIKQWPKYSTRRPPCSTTRKETGCLWRQAAVLYYQAGFIIISEITKKTAEPIAQHSFIKMFKYMSYHPFTSFFFLWGQNELAPILNACIQSSLCSSQITYFTSAIWIKSYPFRLRENDYLVKQIYS